jgi:cysteine desulfurase/selenocysteine lyase
MSSPTKDAIDIAAIRGDFPLLAREIDGKPLVYLDSANTSQKPRQVIDAMTRFMEQSYAPINRSAYRLAAEATDLYEGARRTAQRFINARRPEELVFTKNATEALNLVVGSWGRANLRDGDVVVLTHLEHHANIVPWHMLAAERKIELRWVPLTDDGQLDLSDLPRLLDGAKVFAFSAMSNVLGTITPVAELCRAAHAAGALAIVDGCQYVPHNVTDVQAWDADFVAFSSHKLCGPSGLGVLWGREELLDAMPPFLGGGSMINRVYDDSFTPAELPAKFEAGTPPIAPAIALGAAIDYLNAIGIDAVQRHEHELARYAYEKLQTIDGLRILGPAPDKRSGLVSFVLDRPHAHDVAQLLDEQGIAVRAGHHCTQPLHDRLGCQASTRASFYLYNTPGEVDLLVDTVQKIRERFRAQGRKRKPI